jgi:plastocyanin
MRKMAVAILLTGLLIASWSFMDRALAQTKSNDNNIAIVDDCDPTDPGWAPTGGCLLRTGSVSVAEFNALLFSPKIAGGTIPVGHPAWRNEPSFVSADIGKTVRVKNAGGRNHTFTEVAAFGGGFVAPLNGALTPTTECLAAAAAGAILPPGATLQLNGLSTGTHKFMCCIHPWMHAAVEVE